MNKLYIVSSKSAYSAKVPGIKKDDKIFYGHNFDLMKNDSLVDLIKIRSFKPVFENEIIYDENNLGMPWTYKGFIFVKNLSSDTLKDKYDSSLTQVVSATIIRIWFRCSNISLTDKKIVLLGELLEESPNKNSYVAFNDTLKIII